MENTVIKDIWQFNKGARARIERDLEASEGNELSLIQSMVLVMLSCKSKDRIGAKELQEIFILSKATISETLSVLEAKGYVAVAQSETDKRRKDIVLTPKARATVKTILKMFSRIEAELIMGIDEEDVRTFKEVLGKMGENMRRAK